MFDVFGVVWCGNGWNFLVEQDADGGGGFRIDVDQDGLVQEIAGLFVPMLALAHVGGKLHGVTIGTVERFVDVEDRLDVVVAGSKVGERFEGIAESAGIDDGRRAGFPVVDVEAEELRAGGFLLAELEARLRILRCGNAKKNVAVERFRIGSGGEGNFEAKFRGLRESGRGKKKKDDAW